MSLLDQFLHAVPAAVRKALSATESNALRHPATEPAEVRQHALVHPDGESPDDDDFMGFAERVVAILGPGMTFRGLASDLLPVYADAGVTTLTPDELARGIVFYNRKILGAEVGWPHHKVGLCLPLPIEVNGTAWFVDADKVRQWARGQLPDLTARLSTPPAALEVLDPSRNHGEAFVFALSRTPKDLWRQVLRNPFEKVLVFFSYLDQLSSKDALSAALEVLAPARGDVPSSTKDHQLELLAGTTAGNGILRRLGAVLSVGGPLPPGIDRAAVDDARARVDRTLHLPGSPTLVTPRELELMPEMRDVPRLPAVVVPGAGTDPVGGAHRLVLGRNVAVGRIDKAQVAGATFEGPELAGRLELDRVLADDAVGLKTATAVTDLPGRLAMLALDGVQVRVPAAVPPRTRRPERPDAVRARDARALTIGLGGWSALKPSGSAVDPDGLLALLCRFKLDAPQEFDLYVALHRLDILGDPKTPAACQFARIGPDGTPTAMTDVELRTFLGSTKAEWAARFRLAALTSKGFRLAQVVLAAAQLTPDLVEMAVAGVDPFPPGYDLPNDLTASARLTTEIADDLQPFVDGTGTPIRSSRTFAVALFDLTGPPGTQSGPQPAYFGTHDNDTFYVASMAKTAALYAAFELRHRLRKAAAAAKAANLNVTRDHWETTFLAVVDKVWKRRIAKDFPGLRPSLPRYEDVFTFARGGGIDFQTGGASLPDIIAKGLGQPNPVTMKYVELLQSMIHMSNPIAAGLVIDGIGYSYLNGALREGGFVVPRTRTGIWLSADFAGRDWIPHRDIVQISERGRRHYKPTTNVVGTAKQFAKLLALADRGELFDKDGAACNDMVQIMDKNQNHVSDTDMSPIREALLGMSLTVSQVFSKIGIGDAGTNGLQGLCDCAIVERRDGAKTLRYVMVVVGGFFAPSTERAAFDNVVAILDAGLARTH